MSRRDCATLNAALDSFIRLPHDDQRVLHQVRHLCLSGAAAQNALEQVLGTHCWGLDAVDTQHLHLRLRVREHLKSIETAEVASMRDVHKFWQRMLAGGAA